VAGSISWKREFFVLILLIAVGVVGLPFAIYLVGQYIIGDYAPDAGPMDLVAAIWANLADLQPAAWLLVLSPYLVITLFRMSRRQWRASKRSSIGAA